MLLLCIVLTINVLQAQIPLKKTLVADETWVVASGTGSFRFITSNDSVAKKIVYLEGITRFTASQKVDRYGQYWERSFYFDNKYWNNVIKFIKSL